MKKILIITTVQKAILYLLLLSAAIIVGGRLFIELLINITPAQVAESLTNEEILELEKENSRLKGILASILPNEQKSEYEYDYRSIYKDGEEYTSTPFKTYDLQEVIKKGASCDFEINYNDPIYMRPVYDPSWKDAFFRGWTHLPDKIQEARHKIFVFPLGASSTFDFEGSLGFDGGVAVDAHRNINFLIYNFSVESVKMYGHQVALTGTPAQYGVQIVSIIQNSLLPEGINSADFLFQLSTPEGYEIDYIFYNVIKYEYLKQKIEESKRVPTFSSLNDTLSANQLREENRLLKKELANYIPLQDKIITAAKCKVDMSSDNSDMPNILTISQKGKRLDFNLNYYSVDYKRPLYDPAWKDNYKKGWSYIPKQVCLNFNKLFVIPKDEEERNDLFGALSFHENYSEIKAAETGFLIYGFNVMEVYSYNNQLLFIGKPERFGARIITLNKNNSNQTGNYIVTLATPDFLSIE